MDILHTLISFIVAISILVAFHEFGHFYVARRLGVKVLRFSIGFGKPLFVRRGEVDQTEYMIAAIPLGGYVKMLDEREGEVAEHELHRAFNRQKLWKRFAIVFAGPAFNFIFAVVAYVMFYVIGVSSYQPLVGDVMPGSIAEQSGIRSGMQIAMVNGKQSPIWDVVMQEMLDSVMNNEPVEIALKSADQQSISVSLPALKADGEIKAAELFKQLGFFPWRPEIKSIAGEVMKDSPADIAGLKKHDRIISIDGQPVSKFEEMVSYVSARPGQLLTFAIERNAEQLQLQIAPKAVEHEGKTRGQIGVYYLPAEYPEEMKVVYRFGLVDSLQRSLQRTWNNSLMTLRMMGMIVTGELSIRNLSGPINIAVYAGYSAKAGLSRFLELLAAISLSLGVLNLLPVPLLDGGHLMFYLVEMLKGRPVSEEVEAVAQRIGILILFTLICLVFYNDIMRLIG